MGDELAVAEGVSVRVLGRFQVSAYGQLVIDRRWSRRKSAALLKLLALQEGRALHRDRILDFLWPDLDPEAGGGNLRKALHYLRGAFPEPNVSASIVLTTRDTVALSPDVWLDLDEFRRLGQAATAARTDVPLYEEALSLYAGDLLPDDLYDEWTEPARDEARELYMKLLLELGQLLELRGQFEQAKDVLGRLLQADPALEEGHRALMRIWARTGHLAQCVRQYRICRAELRRELDVEPSEETERLHRAILEGAPRPADGGPALMLEAGVFVGRQDEMDQLRSMIAGALSGRSGVALLSGEPGIGKTRTANELAAYARLRGVQVLTGRCYEGEGRSTYGPWVEILRFYVDDHGPEELQSVMGSRASDIVHLIPELKEKIPELHPASLPEGEEARFRLFDSIAALLKAAARRRPVLLVVDDIHWAGVPSLLLLQFLVRHTADAGILLVATYRDTELGEVPYLPDMLADLHRYEHCVRIRLGGLGPGDVRDLVAAVTVAEVPPGVAEAIYRITEGNPFFIREVLKHLKQKGLHSSKGGSVRVDVLTAGRVELPDSVREVIGRRIASLSEGCRRLLGLASVVVGDLTWEVLSAASSEAEDRLFDLLDEARDADILREQAASGRITYSFSHALIRATLYDELSAPRRAAFHRSVGEAIERVAGEEDGPFLTELAHHFFEAGSADDLVKAVGYAKRAGDRATAMLGFEEAARLYERALKALQLGSRDHEADRCALLLALGEAHRRSGDAGRSRASFLAAAGLARSLDTPERLAEAALGFAGTWVKTGEVDRRVVALLEEALSTLGGRDSRFHVLLLNRLAAELMYSDERQRRLDISRQALEIAQRLGDPSTLTLGLYARYVALTGPDEIEEQLAVATEIVRVEEGLGNKEAAYSGHAYRFRSLLDFGDVEAAQAEMRALVLLARELGQPMHNADVEAKQAMLHQLAGQFAEGIELATRAFADGRLAHHPDAVEWFTMQDLQYQRERGQSAQVESSLAGLVQQHRAVPVWRAALALVQAELGLTGKARGNLDLLARDGLGRLPRDDTWLFTLGLIAETCALLGDKARARAVYPLLHPYSGRNVVMPEAIACSGSASRYLGLLATLLRRWDDAVHHFERALEMNASMGARPYLSHTQYDYAAMLLARRRSDDGARAVELLGQALDTAEELKMAALAKRSRALIKACGHESVG